MLKLLVVAAAGGLGSAVVREAMSRNHSVSVLVRSSDKLRAALGDETVQRLHAVHVGSAGDAAAVAAAVQGARAVISCAPPDPALASTLAEACKATGAKIMWTAGACVRPAAAVSASAVVGPRLPFAPLTSLRTGGSNMFEADGVTYHYKAFGPAGDGFFAAHSPCIDAVKASGATHIIWCPGVMRTGARTTPAPKTLLFADPAGLAAWDFVSYGVCLHARSCAPAGDSRGPPRRAEDAAQVMLSAVETTEFDGKHISALSPPPRQRSSEL